jgi:hypothetical protein
MGKPIVLSSSAIKLQDERSRIRVNLLSQVLPVLRNVDLFFKLYAVPPKFL